MAEEKDAFIKDGNEERNDLKRRKLAHNEEDEEDDEEEDEKDVEALLYISTLPGHIQNAINYDNNLMEYDIHPVDVEKRNVSLDSFCYNVVKSAYKHDDFSNTVTMRSTVGGFSITTSCTNMLDKENLNIIFSLKIKKEKMIFIASPKEFEPGEWDLTNDIYNSSYKSIEAIASGNKPLFQEGFAMLMRRISQVLLGKNSLFLTSLVVHFTN